MSGRFQFNSYSSSKCLPMNHLIRILFFLHSRKEIKLRLPFWRIKMQTTSCLCFSQCNYFKRHICSTDKTLQSDPVASDIRNENTTTTSFRIVRKSYTPLKNALSYTALKHRLSTKSCLVMIVSSLLPQIKSSLQLAQVACLYFFVQVSSSHDLRATIMESI